MVIFISYFIDKFAIVKFEINHFIMDIIICIRVIELRQLLIKEAKLKSRIKVLNIYWPRLFHQSIKYLLI